MQTLIEQGIAFIISLQAVGGWPAVPMQLFSYLGTEDFFFIVLPLLYWSVDASLGLRVAFILSTSNVLNYFFKLVFAGPRPYWVEPQVQGMWEETSFGVPSGHAQLAVGVWGAIAAFYKRRWAWVIAIIIIFMIGFSRLYLGVHFPHDVVVGWFLGAITLWLFVRFWDPAERWLSTQSFQQKITYAFVISLFFIGLGFSAVTMRSDFIVPEEWTKNALLDLEEKPAPVEPSGIFTSAGTFFGLCVGAAWIMSNGGYQASGTVQKRSLRYVLGLIGVLILWMGLGEIFPRGDGLLPYTLRYIRYALVGFWVTGGAPWMFIRMKIASRNQ